MTRLTVRQPREALAAICLTALAAVAAPAPVAAMQILDATDHAELTAEISATDVNRIALAGDRVARVVRAPDGYAVEHDARSGDLYLRPFGRDASDGAAVTMFIGTERGFTYRLTLIPSDRDSAQILIRNATVLPDETSVAMASASDEHIAALVRLVRAVARRTPRPGYAIQGEDGPAPAGLSLIETWRGPRFAALVFEAARPASEDADGFWSGHGSGLAGLAGTIGETLRSGRFTALWLAPAGTGPSGGRLAVAVVETAPAGEPR